MQGVGLRVEGFTSSTQLYDLGRGGGGGLCGKGSLIKDDTGMGHQESH